MRRLDSGNIHRATRQTSRELNRQIVLALVQAHQPISRADVARRMQISRGMVTELVSALLSDGLIYEGARGAAVRGRRPTSLFIRTADRLVLSVDIRATQTFVGIGDFSGALLATEVFDTVLEPDVLADLIAARVSGLRDRYGHRGTCEGLGIVVPGMVDRHTQRVLRAPQLGWRDVDLLPMLADRTALRCAIENAPIACALAHMWFGEQTRAAASSSFVYVTVSDGVGTGIVFRGEVLRGAVGTAGEFGHVPLAPDGPRCSCGARGCLEAFVSNIATRHRYATIASGADDDHSTPTALVAIDEIIARANAGELAALTAVRETGNYLGLGLATIVNALNPALIIVGGEITGAWSVMDDAIRDALESRGLTHAATSTPIVPDRTPMPRLRGAMALVAAPQWAIPDVG